MARLPKTLNFIPTPSDAVAFSIMKGKEPEILSLRDRGCILADKYKKSEALFTSKDIDWIFYDSLITMEKADFNEYYEVYEPVLRERYPWDILHWANSWYLIWKYLRLNLHVKLPNDDALLFFSLLFPPPPGFVPPDFSNQEWSFYKVIQFFHTIKKKERVEEILEEILNSQELLVKIIKGEILPYEYLEVLSYPDLYSKITKKILLTPQLALSLPKEQQKTIENLRVLDGSEQVMFKAPWFLEMLRKQKEGVPVEEILSGLMENPHED